MSEKSENIVQFFVGNMLLYRKIYDIIIKNRIFVQSVAHGAEKAARGEKGTG